MTHSVLETYCLAKEGVIKTFPFDATTVVYKVSTKMFVLSNISSDIVKINVKCDPLYALELRLLYKSIIAGYHMNKKHWNTVTCNQEIEDALIFEFIDESYTLVYKGLSKKEKATLAKED